MKTFNVLSLCILALASITSLSSCSDSDDTTSTAAIAGTWICTETNCPNSGAILFGGLPIYDYDYSFGFAVGDAMVLFNDYITWPEGIGGNKCFLYPDYDDIPLSDMTVLLWNELYDPEDHHGLIYNYKNNELTIMECDFDRFVGEVKISGDELTYTYHYENWRAISDTQGLLTDVGSTFISKFRRQ